MKLPFHLVLTFAERKEWLIKKATDEFFQNTGFPSEKETDKVEPLFAEWLIYDFSQENGASFIAEYFLRNPDNLDSVVKERFRQVIETQWYGGFEIGKRKIGKWFEAEHLFSGKKIRIFDKHASTNLPSQGTIIGRVAFVEGKWILVGAVPLYIPITYTSQMKKQMKKNTSIYSSPKEAWALFVKQNEKTPPPKLNYKQIEKKRKEIQLKYKSITKNMPGCITFEQLIKKIYEENGDEPLNVWRKIKQEGLSDKLFINEINLFNDIWNFFPHRILNDNSPVELINKFSGVTKKK